MIQMMLFVGVAFLILFLFSQSYCLNNCLFPMEYIVGAKIEKKLNKEYSGIFRVIKSDGYYENKKWKFPVEWESGIDDYKEVKLFIYDVVLDEIIEDKTGYG